MSRVRGRLDHADLVRSRAAQPQLLPGRTRASFVRHLGQCLERVIVAVCERRHRPAVARRAPARSAHMSVAFRIARRRAWWRSDNCWTKSLLPNHRATEVLRPWLVRGHVEDHVADLAGAQLLRLWRKAEERIGFPFGEQLHEVASGWRTQSMSVCGSSPTYAAMTGRNRCALEPASGCRPSCPSGR